MSHNGPCARSFTLRIETCYATNIAEIRKDSPTCS